MEGRKLSRRQVLQAAAGTGLVLGAGGILAACGSDGGSSGSGGGTPTKGGNLRVGLTGGGNTETLDPFVPLLAPDILRGAMLYSYVGEFNGEYEPTGLMAESVESVDDKGQVWDLTLRNGMEFHNGKTVTSDDVIWSFQHLMDPKTGASGAALLPWIDPKNIKKINKRTTRFTLTRPVSIFEQALYNFATTIVPANFNPAKPVGAGAFKLKSFKPGDRSVFTRFDNFYGKKAYVDQVEVISFKDSTALVNALSAGDIDVAQSVGFSNAAVVESAGNQAINTPGMFWFPLTMSVDDPAFEDERVREAFRLIPDRQQMVDQAYAGYGAIGNDLYAWDDPAYNSGLPQREQDLDKAKQLLAQAGQENLSIELATTAALPGQVETCQVFAEQAKGAGVDVKVVNRDPDTFYTDYYMQAPFSSDTFTNLPYLNNTLQCQLPESYYNQSHFDDPQFNKLYDQALSEMDETKRTAIEKQMQEIQYERGALVIAAQVDNIDAAAPNVGGLQPDLKWYAPLNGYHLENVYLS